MPLRLLTIILLCLIINSYSHAQYIKGNIVDSATNKTVQGAHLMQLSNSKFGTISNEDGSFILSNQLKNDSVLVSHINYYPKKTVIKEGILIKLIPSETILKEVVVRPLEVNKIMNKVFENLKQNHQLEGVTYQFFYRNLNYSKDSTLHFVEEHQGLIHQNKRDNSKFKLEDSRIKAFSEKGEKELKDQRLIRFGMIQADNMFKYLEDYLHHRKSKDYQYTLESTLDFNGRKVFKISFTTDKSTYYKSGYLLIDHETYGVVRNVLNSSDYKEVNFTYHAGKWYLSHSYSMTRRADKISEAVINYILSEKSYEKSEFKSAMSLMPEQIENKAGDYSDEYWATSNIIPLPDWVKKQIEE